MLVCWASLEKNKMQEFAVLPMFLLQNPQEYLEAEIVLLTAQSAKVLSWTAISKVLTITRILLRAEMFVDQHGESHHLDPYKEWEYRKNLKLYK